MSLREIKSMSIDGEALRLHELYKRGEVSPVEVARAQLGAIGRLNPGVNAFALVDDCVALEMAQASEARYRRGEALGPLDGVPITIKDKTVLPHSRPAVSPSGSRRKRRVLRS